MAAWDLANAVYDSKSFAVTTQNSLPRTIRFKSDGSKMYMQGNTASTDAIYQYSLSTPWDISTASYDSVSFSTSAQNDSATAMDWKPDGSKVFVGAIGSTADAVYEYTVGTPWVVSSMSYASRLENTSAQDQQITGLAFKPDGSKFYMVGIQNDRVHQYSMSTAWQLGASSSYDSVFLSVSTQTASPGDLAFNDDGSRMYVCDQNAANPSVFQYNLSTAWDLSTASYASISYTSAENNAVESVAFKPDGTQMYLLGSDGTVYQYSFAVGSGLVVGFMTLS